MEYRRRDVPHKRVDTGGAVHKTDRNGDIYYLYPSESGRTFDPSVLPSPPPEAERATPDVLDSVYRPLLRELPINTRHIAELEARGIALFGGLFESQT